MTTQLRDSKGRFLSTNGSNSSSSNGSNGTNGHNGSFNYSEYVSNTLKKELARSIQTVNATTRRKSQLYDQWMDPRRDINDECGYPKEPSIAEMKEMYDFESIAARVVEVLPEETWKISPYIFETEDIEDETEFEKALKQLSKDLSTDADLPQGEESYFEDEQNNPIWELLARVDKLSGIGRYGVIFLGVDDGKPYDQPINGKRENKLLFARAIDEPLIEIQRYDEDRRSKRYGRPIMYDITFNDPRLVAEGAGYQTTAIKVHWSRVIHIADNRDASEVFGVPRQRPVFKRLMDLSKLYGGSAEMYWKGAFPGFSLETHPELGGDVDLPSDIKDEIENWQNGLQRVLAIAGTTVKSIAPQVEDPTAQIDAQLDAICIKLGIPKRIFMGSERGKLASTQDDATWKERIRGRRQKYVTPRVIVPFVNRLISINVLPAPEKYQVRWYDLDILDPLAKSDILLKRTDAMTRYVNSEAQKVMSLEDYLHREMGYTKEEARVIAEAREEDPMLKKEPEPNPFQEGGPNGKSGSSLPANQPKDPRRIRSDTTRMDGSGES